VEGLDLGEWCTGAECKRDVGLWSRERIKAEKESGCVGQREKRKRKGWFLGP